jgi:hypothetical protein
MRISSAIMSRSSSGRIAIATGILQNVLAADAATGYVSTAAPTTSQTKDAHRGTAIHIMEHRGGRTWAGLGPLSLAHHRCRGQITTAALWSLLRIHLLPQEVKRRRKRTRRWILPRSFRQGSGWAHVAALRELTGGGGGARLWKRAARHVWDTLPIASRHRDDQQRGCGVARTHRGRWRAVWR